MNSTPNGVITAIDAKTADAVFIVAKLVARWRQLPQEEEKSIVAVYFVNDSSPLLIEGTVQEFGLVMETALEGLREPRTYTIEGCAPPLWKDNGSGDYLPLKTEATWEKG